MRKAYQKPTINSERMFEQGALGCATQHGSDYDCRAKAGAWIWDCRYNIKS